jgi:hypothetical protein
VAPGAYALIETRGVIAPARVMFLGTPPLREFGYGEMQEFARRSMQILTRLSVPPKVVTTTVHGSGYGLDGGESMQRLIRGFEEGLSEKPTAAIEKIVFLTNGQRESRTLAYTLASMNLGHRLQAGESTQAVRSARMEVPGDAGVRTVPGEFGDQTPRVGSVPHKKHVFVAMPYSEEFENVYEYGVYPAVRNCGFICEKVDEAHFTGDILSRIKHGIETASIVIADLTQARPNVYLEVGYAWGRGTRVIFLAKKGESLHFDVSTHKCLYYGTFRQLAKELEQLLRGLEASGEI